jgi:hypothetical protein
MMAASDGMAAPSSAMTPALETAIPLPSVRARNSCSAIGDLQRFPEQIMSTLKVAAGMV